MLAKKICMVTLNIEQFFKSADTKNRIQDKSFTILIKSK